MHTHTHTPLSLAAPCLLPPPCSLSLSLPPSPLHILICSFLISLPPFSLPPLFLFLLLSLFLSPCPFGPIYLLPLTAFSLVSPSSGGFTAWGWCRITWIPFTGCPLLSSHLSARWILLLSPFDIQGNWGTGKATQPINKYLQSSYNAPDTLPGSNDPDRQKSRNCPFQFIQGRACGWQEAVKIPRHGQCRAPGPFPKNSKALLSCMSVKQQAWHGRKQGQKEKQRKGSFIFQCRSHGECGQSQVRKMCIDHWSPDMVSAASMKLACWCLFVLMEFTAFHGREAVSYLLFF